MSQPITPRQLKRLAAKASAAPEFLGYLLEGYKQRRNIGDAALASTLGCDIDTIYRLCLCLAPAAVVGDEFRDYVSALGEYLLLDRAHLAGLLREVISLSKVSITLPTAHSITAQLPLAARDHDASDLGEEERPDSTAPQTDEASHA